MTHPTIPHISASALDGYGITAAQVVAMMEQLVAAGAAGTAYAAPKAVLTPPDGRYIMATLAGMSDPAFVATKSLVLNERNVDAGLPVINALVSLLDGNTGVPLATMDGNWITANRTAGLSLLGAKYLARADSGSIGFVGTGVQARSHLDLFAQWFPLRTVRISGRGQANIDRLVAQAEALGLSAQVVDRPEDALDGVDIGLTSLTHTAIKAPFLRADIMAQGSCLISADLSAPWHHDSFAALDVLAVDDLVQEDALPNKMARRADIDCDLAGLVTGQATGRSDATQRTGFVFRGHALGDLAGAVLAYRAFQAQQ